MDPKLLYITGTGIIILALISSHSGHRIERNLPFVKFDTKRSRTIEFIIALIGIVLIGWGAVLHYSAQTEKPVPAHKG